MATIVETAVQAGTFSTLVAAVQAAGLVEALSEPGPYTVFAPTDEAFAELPEGTLEQLLEDIPQLTAILKYHVVPGRFVAADVMEMHTAMTLLGKELAFDSSEGVRVNDAYVSQADIACDNGVIHVIDGVLLPE